MGRPNQRLGVDNFPLQRAEKYIASRAVSGHRLTWLNALTSHGQKRHFMPLGLH